MLQANNINDSATSVTVAAVYFLVGLIGGAFSAWFLAKTAKFKLLQIIFCIGLTISYFFTFFGAWIQSTIMIIVFAGIAGFFGVASQGNILSFCSQIAFPTCN